MVAKWKTPRHWPRWKHGDWPKTLDDNGGHDSWNDDDHEWMEGETLT